MLAGLIHFVVFSIQPHTSINYFDYQKAGSKFISRHFPMSLTILYRSALWNANVTYF